MKDLDNLNKDVASNIRLLRKNKRLTQEEVAEGIDISLIQYSRIERGLAELHIVTVTKIAIFFDVSIDEILFGLEGKPSNTKWINLKGHSFEEKVKMLVALSKEKRKLACDLLDLILKKDQNKQ